MGKEIVFDIETNGLDATLIWCICAADIKSGETYSFTLPTGDLHKAKELLESADRVIGHNIINFDLPVLKRLLNINIDQSKVVDTLVLSRLYSPTREGGHSLEEWGTRLNYKKQEHEEWDVFSKEMLTRCQTDVNLNVKVFRALCIEGKKYHNYCKVLEHKVSFILQETEEKGFYLNRDKALNLLIATKSKCLELERLLLTHCRPHIKLIKPYMLVKKKDGSLTENTRKALAKYKVMVVDGTEWFVEESPLNLSSPKQVIELMSESGWKPTKFTDKGSPILCEENFNTLPSDAPKEFQLFRDYRMLLSRYKTVEQWIEAADKNDRVHCHIISVGAVTHRMAHRNPNIANIPSVISRKVDGKKQIVMGMEGGYGFECRDCWGVKDDTRRLVGVDAKGIQLRVLAHYMNDKDYTDTILDPSGDIHMKNMVAAGLKTRDQAKTFIYAWLLGAGNAKIAEIAGDTPEITEARRILKEATKDKSKLKEELDRLILDRGKEINDRFLNSLPALKRLKNEANANGRRGFMIGLDGRVLPIKAQHYALSAYLQGGEQSIMKQALVLWHEEAKKRNIDCHLAAMIHDEFQIDCEAGRAEELAQIVVESIRKTTEVFKLNCPMDGDARIGMTWADTH